MPHGASPGERRGGRKAGVPNRSNALRAERAIAEGRKLPADELLSNAEKCRAMVEHFEPTKLNQDTGQMEANPDHDLKEYRDWLADWRDALKAAAPFYSPRLSAIAMQTATLDRDKEARADPRVALLELILEMRARDPGGQQRAITHSVIPAPKGNGHGDIIEAVVNVVEEDEEDNGDGIAS